MMVSTSAVFLNKLRRIRSGSTFFCFVGLALSCYAFYVETKKEYDDSYVAMCDINEHMSCTKVFSSKYIFTFLLSHLITPCLFYMNNTIIFRYGKGFGLLQYILDENSPLIQPNPVYGVIFYLLVLFLGKADL